MEVFEIEMSREEEHRMSVIFALALIKNLFLKGQISERVYKNILKDYEKEVDIAE